MGSQSAVMMKMAGEQWQYGKRRISAMSNEDFNKMTPLKLFQIETQELKQMIPLMEDSMKSMNQLTPMIVKEMVDLVKVFIEVAPDYILKLLGIDAEGVITGKTPGEIEYEHFLHGHEPGHPAQGGGGGSGIPPPPPPEKEKETDAERLERLEQIYKQLIDTSIVPSGSTRPQLIVAIKKSEAYLKVLNDIHNKRVIIAKGNPTSSNTALIKQSEARVKLQIRVVRQFKDALNYINSNGLTKTP